MAKAKAVSRTVTYNYEVEAQHQTATEEDGSCVLCVLDKTSTTMDAAVRRAVFLWQFIPKSTKVKMVITHITEGKNAGCTFWEISRKGKVRQFDFIEH